jgi:hypothetical protein
MFTTVLETIMSCDKDNKGCGCNEPGPMIAAALFILFIVTIFALNIAEHCF